MCSARQCLPAKEITSFLLEKYGPLLNRDHLTAVLGYASTDAFERSVQRGHLRLKLIRMPGRRGMFALAPDVAQYLMEMSRDGDVPRSRSEEGQT